MSKPIPFRATARIASLASHAAVLVEVLGLALGVGSLIVGLALGALSPEQVIAGQELLLLGALIGASAGFCWWIERRPTTRGALWRVDRWFELDGALVTAWELEGGVLDAPNFREALTQKVARVVVDRKEIGRAAFALTLPILLVPLAGAAVLVGVQEERAGNVAALSKQITGAADRENGAVALDANGAANDQVGDQVGTTPALDVELALVPGDPLLAEIKQLESLMAELESGPRASEKGGADESESLTPEARAAFEQRIEERIAALKASLSDPSEEAKPVRNAPGAESGPQNPSNPVTDDSSGVTNGAPKGRIRRFQGISPTGVWWPERQDGIVRSWLLRLEGEASAAE
jgi:hypothetical protein